jgi:histone H3/H4
METSYWRKCGSCKKEIGFNVIYQVCSVSSCSKHVFCSVNCWDMHNPIMNHKSSWAEEMRSPRREDALPQAPEAPRRVIIASKQTISSSQESQEVLIVASKLKQYIKDKYDMNTAGSVMDTLSKNVRRLTDRAAEKAKSEGRKTIMDRDFDS